jgi:ribosomal protein S18 acetylase RimI-like enzyme
MPDIPITGSPDGHEERPAPPRGEADREWQKLNIQYDSNRTISAGEFIDLLHRSTLAERRPVDDADCMTAMLANAGILCSAWDGDKLVGIARSVTDFTYCCYLSDLAVDRDYQHQGIGRELVRLTQSKLGPKAKLILLSAPGAVDYYPRIGFEAHPSAWIIDSRKPLK